MLSSTFDRTYIQVINPQTAFASLPRSCHDYILGTLISPAQGQVARAIATCRLQGTSRGQMASLILSRPRKSFISQRALAEVLSLLPKDEEEPASSRAALKRKRDRGLNLNTPYGPLWKEMTGFVMKEGPPLKIVYLDPIALLWTSCSQGGGFQSFWSDVASRHACDPSHPWDICLYVDEVSPGNQLKPSNERKLQVIYFSVKQFGKLALSKEDAWWVLTAVCSADVKRVEDGMAQVMKRILRIFLLERRDALLHGVLLPFPNNQKWTLCCKLGSLTLF